MGGSIINRYKWLEGHAGLIFGLGMLGLIYSTYKRWKTISYSIDHHPTNSSPHIPSLPKYPRVSILIPAWNESDYVAENLHSALALRYPAKEVIMCAGGQDDTYQIAKSFENQGVIVIKQTPRMGKQKALQCCFELSTGDIIYLTDADCVLDDDSFEATIAPLLIGEESSTTGNWQPFPKERSNLIVEYQWRQHMNWQNNRPDYAYTLHGANAALKREVLDSIQGFTAQAPIGTDYTLSKVLASHGFKIRTVAGSRIYTHYPKTVRQYLHQLSRWFRNRLLLGIRYRVWRDVRTSLRAGGSAGLILGLPLILWAKSRLVFSLWALLSLHALEQNWVVVASGRSDYEPVWSLKSFQMTLLLTPINLLGMVWGFVDSLIPSRGHNW